MERDNFMVVNGPADDPLELRLGGHYGLSPPYFTDTTGSNIVDFARQLLDEQRRQITVFYNGRISVCDVTNYQAGIIMGMANNEIKNNKYGNQVEDKEAIARETVELQPGLSMKRSLQRFLQKRKARMADHSFPYGHRKPLQLF